MGGRRGDSLPELISVQRLRVEISVQNLGSLCGATPEGCASAGPQASVVATVRRLRTRSGRSGTAAGLFGRSATTKHLPRASYSPKAGKQFWRR